MSGLSWKRISTPGVLVSAILIAGLLGPWLTVNYDSYVKLNPETKTGERFYHSRVELNPLFGSVIENDVVVTRNWFITPGITLSGIMLALSAALAVFKYGYGWVHAALFFLALLGTLVFFMSIGAGVSIGVATKIGWGLSLSGLGLITFFAVAFRELSLSMVSRYVD